MSLGTSLSIGVQALNAESGALQATNNNIANSNTPGYSRQTVLLDEGTPTDNGGISEGSGVVLEGFQSVRDELIQNQIQSETQAQSSANAQTASLQQIQPTFTTSTQDIGTQMSALFTSLSSLSADPTNSTNRQAVLTAGQNLATAFNATSSVLTTQQLSLNAKVTQDVSKINSLTQEIAALSPQLAELKSSGQDGGTLQDQQNQLVLQLSALTNVSVTRTEGADTLTTGNGTPLVVGSESQGLQTTTAANGMVQVLDSNGANVTSALSGGDLGGTVEMRDQTIPSLLNHLDTLANQFGTAFNAVQSSGTDGYGNAGSQFFSIPAVTAGSAAAISVSMTDPTEIAASTDGSTGGNGNMASFSALQTVALPSGQSPTSTYANLVDQVGSLTANASAESGATTASLLQLNDQFSSVSGVSIDQESTNLITYQTAYEAAARVVTTIQALFQVTLAMGTASAE